MNFYSICECVLLYILHITAADAFPGAVVEEQMLVPSPMVILRNGQFYEFLRIIFYEFLRIVFLKKRLYLCGRLFMTARRFLNKRRAR